MASRAVSSSSAKGITAEGRICRLAAASVMRGVAQKGQVVACTPSGNSVWAPQFGQVRTRCSS